MAVPLLEVQMGKDLLSPSIIYVDRLFTVDNWDRLDVGGSKEVLGEASAYLSYLAPLWPSMRCTTHAAPRNPFEGGFGSLGRDCPNPVFSAGIDCLLRGTQGHREACGEVIA